MSSGGGAKRPAWRWPCDRSVAHHPATLMHLSLARVGLGTITLSAPGLSSLSFRWHRAMNSNLLCSCAFASFSCLDAMPPARCICRGSLPTLRSPATCITSSYTYITCASSLCLHFPSGPPECQGKGENQSAAWPGSQADREWSSDPRLHHPLTHHLLHLPRTPLSHSHDKVPLTSRSSPRPPLVGWNGLPSLKIHWVSTQGLLSIWLHPRCRFLQSHQIHLRAHQSSKRTHPVGLTWERHQISWGHNQGLNPSQIQYQTHNCRTTSLSCKVWSLSCDKAWTTFSFDWKSWMERPQRSYKCSPLCRGLITRHQEQAKPQRKETETSQGMEEQMLQGLATKTIRALPCTCPWKREVHLSKRKGLAAKSTQE
jgi:hypothetical protein